MHERRTKGNALIFGVISFRCWNPRYGNRTQRNPTRQCSNARCSMYLLPSLLLKIRNYICLNRGVGNSHTQLSGVWAQCKTDFTQDFSFKNILPLILAFLSRSQVFSKKMHKLQVMEIITRKANLARQKFHRSLKKS